MTMWLQGLDKKILTLTFALNQLHLTLLSIVDLVMFLEEICTETNLSCVIILKGLQ